MMQPRLTLDLRSVGFFFENIGIAFSVLMETLLDKWIEDGGGVMVVYLHLAMQHPSTTTSWLISTYMRASGGQTSATTADFNGIVIL